MATESASSTNGTQIPIWLLVVGAILAASFGIYHYWTKNVETDSEENSTG